MKFLNYLSLLSFIPLFGCNGVGTLNVECKDSVCSTVATADLTDDDNSQTGFGGGAHSSTTYSSSALTLNASTNTFSVAESWTPDYSSLFFGAHLDGTVGVISNGSFLAADIGAYSATVLNSGDNSTTYVSSKLGQGVTLDGSDDYLDFSDIDALDNTSAFTASLWVKHDVLNCDGSYFSKYLDANNHIILQTSCGAQGGTNDLTVSLSQGSAAYGYSTSDIIQTGQWYNVVVRYNGAGATNADRLKLYVNGEELGLTFSGTIPATTDDNAASFRLGRSNSSYELDGTLDEVIFWSTALSETKIKLIYERQSASYSGQFTSRVMEGASATADWSRLDWLTTLPFGKELPDGGGTANSETSTDYSSLIGTTAATGDDDLMSSLIALYHFNETAAGSATGGNDFEDQSGLGNHASDSGALVTSYTSDGRFGTGVSLDGASGDSIDLSAATDDFDGDEGSASVWVYRAFPDDTASNKGIFDMAQVSSVGLSYNAGSDAWYFLRVGTGFRVSSAAANLVPVATWTHMAVTWSLTSGRQKMYINGVEVDDDSMNGAWDDSVAFNRSEVGRVTGTTSWEGKLDEFAMWSRELNATEVLQLFQRGANRVNFQVRTCVSSDCTDQDALSGDGWLGPDGSNLTYFNELYNNTTITAGAISGNVQTTTPQLTFSDFDPSLDTGTNLTSKQYFQYRTILESHDENTACSGGTATCLPDVKEVTIQP